MRIVFNDLSPSMMETKFVSQIPELLIQQKRQESPNGSNVLVKDVVHTILYLLSEESNLITGQNIDITGGN